MKQDNKCKYGQREMPKLHANRRLGVYNKMLNKSQIAKTVHNKDILRSSKTIKSRSEWQRNNSNVK